MPLIAAVPMKAPRHDSQRGGEIGARRMMTGMRSGMLHQLEQDPL